MPSFLYFIQAGGFRGPVKIGHSADVEKRLASLQTGNHLPLTLLAKCEDIDAAQTERDLHNLLSAQRLEGEWFAWSELIPSIVLVHKACESYDRRDGLL